MRLCWPSITVGNQVSVCSLRRMKHLRGCWGGYIYLVRGQVYLQCVSANTPTHFRGRAASIDRWCLSNWSLPRGIIGCFTCLWLWPLGSDSIHHRGIILKYDMVGSKLCNDVCENICVHGLAKGRAICWKSCGRTTVVMEIVPSLGWLPHTKYFYKAWLRVYEVDT